ncbi:hypothetical protein GCM10017750_31100 [Streptomyces racemochromogenes]
MIDDLQTHNILQDSAGLRPAISELRDPATCENGRLFATHWQKATRCAHRRASAAGPEMRPAAAPSTLDW